jgi:hypothetical protein
LSLLGGHFQQRSGRGLVGQMGLAGWRPGFGPVVVSLRAPVDQTALR